MILSRNILYSSAEAPSRILSVYYRLNTCCCVKFHNEGTNTTKLDMGRAEAYRVLYLPENCSLNDAKKAYFDQAKKYHPDRCKQSDTDMFLKIENAFRIVIDDINEQIKEDENDNQNILFDIKHTAPQHRQYLEFEGIGAGTPLQRKRQYEQYRVSKAAERIYDYRVCRHVDETSERSIIERDRAKDIHLTRQFKTSNAIERIVEDLIQESMSRGEFSNLQGVGKPLKKDHALEYNPHLDTSTHKLNQILINNGFTPEWITLEKEIREALSQMRQRFVQDGVRLMVEYGDNRKSEKAQDKTEGKVWDKGMDKSRYKVWDKRWGRMVNRLYEEIEQVNGLIERFNMVVPMMSRQIIPLDGAREVARLSERCEKWDGDNDTHTGGERSPDKQSSTDHVPTSGRWMRLVLKIFRSYMV